MTSTTLEEKVKQAMLQIVVYTINIDPSEVPKIDKARIECIINECVAEAVEEAKREERERILSLIQTEICQELACKRFDRIDTYKYIQIIIEEPTP